MHIGGVIVTIYMVIGIVKHTIKHSKERNGTSTKNITYREDGSVESIYKKRFLGYASKYFYRKDSSLWKKENFFWGTPMETYTLFYPSGRVKYEKE